MAYAFFPLPHTHSPSKTYFPPLFPGPSHIFPPFSFSAPIFNFHRYPVLAICLIVVSYVWLLQMEPSGSEPLLSFMIYQRRGKERSIGHEGMQINGSSMNNSGSNTTRMPSEASFRDILWGETQNALLMLSTVIIGTLLFIFLYRFWFQKTLFTILCIAYYGFWFLWLGYIVLESARLCVYLSASLCSLSFPPS